MELKEFIKTVLVDICSAVDEAKRDVKNAAIAPAKIDDYIYKDPQPINFEVSVTVTDTVKGEGGGKVKILSMSASAGAEAAKESQYVNKISFDVPVFFSAQYVASERK